MTVERLIQKLEGIENKQEKVVVSIGQYNKVGKIAWCEIHENDYDNLQTAWGEHRIEITLPNDKNSFMYTSIKKL